MKKLQLIGRVIELSDGAVDKIMKLCAEKKLPPKFNVEGEDIITKEIVGEVISDPKVEPPVEAPVIENTDESLFADMKLEDRMRQRGVDMSWLDRARGRKAI